MRTQINTNEDPEISIRCLLHLLEGKVAYVYLAADSVSFQSVCQCCGVAKERITGHSKAHNSRHYWPRMDANTHLISSCQ